MKGLSLILPSGWGENWRDVGEEESCAVSALRHQMQYCRLTQTNRHMMAMRAQPAKCLIAFV